MLMHMQRMLLLIAVATLAAASARAAEPQIGVPVSYELPPADGPLPKTYCVTLAIVDAQNPDWIISQFVNAEPRTVTAENKGRFTETWDGLDDNFMPVPAGTYGVKGIYMPATKWQVDGEYHSVTPQFVSGASAWLPTPEQWNKPEPFGGDPVGCPLGDVDAGPNGVAVFYYVYLENGLNNAMIDLRKQINYEQFIRAFGSGCAAGGSSTCTDGETVWSFSTDGGPKYVYRADGRPFGTGIAARSDIYLPEGWVKAMAAWRGQAAGKSYVYVAQHGKILQTKEWPYFAESDKEFVDKVTIHDGANGAVLAEIPVRDPRGVVARAGTLYVLHATDGGFAVSSAPLNAGEPVGPLKQVFALPAAITPADLEVDSRSRFYVSDSAANKVHQLDRTGKIIRGYGRLDRQQPGAYDPLTFIAPGKLATWTDADGNDRLLVVEHGGPNRVSEWSADDGKLLREFTSLQTKANDGYAIDPEDPRHVYVGGHRGWLTRFKVDYAKGTWTVDAVWPDVGTDPLAPTFDHPQFVNANGSKFIACARSYNVFRLAGDRWLLSAAIIRRRAEGANQRMQHFVWHDANGDGRVQDEEYRDTPLEMPGWVLRYHGEQWLGDLSLLAMNQAGREIWCLAPAKFDEHGNPVFTKWEKVLTDPIFEARARGTADAVHGGNELDDKFSSDWAMADGTMQDGFYVNARGGPNFSANEGGQAKISRYVPDAKGGYSLKWRTGRRALQGLAKRGEIYAAIHINKPINGLLSVVDQSRCGVLLYTEDGLYVDAIFPDGRRLSPSVAGVYPQPGEFFAGVTYPNRQNGRIYFGMGKYTPMLFEAQGWSLTENPVHALTTVQKSVTISAAQIAGPPEIALSLRGGAGAAKLARFAPALGGAVLDGSMLGWESCDPVRFQADNDQTVEVRCLYDPDNLYLRWHARLATQFQPRALQPIDRIFTHDRLSDTLSLYIQGDPNAKPNGPVGGRPGDVRMVFGIFKDGDAVRPAALGLYPSWNGAGKANPTTYRTIVGKVDFAHVGPVPGAQVNHVLDDDGKGFVLTAAIPRSAIPGVPPLAGGVRTTVNFEATFNGHNKFWWANADGSASRETYDEPTEARLYPGSWAPAQFLGLGTGVVVQNWMICGPFGGPGAEKFRPDLLGLLPGTKKDYKQAGRELCEAAVYPPDDGVVDTKAAFTGEMIRGYWNDPGRVRWKPAKVADLDLRVVLGPAAQVWYGATWIHVPVQTELEFQFQGHPQTSLRWTLNGEKVMEGEIAGDPGKAASAKTVILRKGWKQVTFRGYCVGYPPFRAGLVIAGAPEKLWTLRLSAVPPGE